jgi:hypothetical protein
MSSESVCQVALSWVDVGSFHTRLVVRFMIVTAAGRNILDKPRIEVELHSTLILVQPTDITCTQYTSSRLCSVFFRMSK